MRLPCRPTVRRTWQTPQRSSLTPLTPFISTFRRQLQIQNGHRSRLSEFWTPTGGIASGASGEEDSQALLTRAGFMRQAHTGIFHFLPLGLRVQEKLESLITQHMRQLGASKVFLSSLSSEELWRRTGRFIDGSGEFFRLKDRKNSLYLLCPTHEEEITNIVANTVKSYRDCPLRLFQINRKYRDELRPRQGLLRTREFVMKDLYTFDSNEKEALATYDSVLKTYLEIFNQFKIPYIVAKADSGNMGGSLSHEIHLPTTHGEDDVVSCNSCDYSANEEVAESYLPRQREERAVSWTLNNSQSSSEETDEDMAVAKSRVSPESDPFAIDISVWSTTTRDRKGLINVFYPSKGVTASGKNPQLRKSQLINMHRIKKLAPSADTGIEKPIEAWKGNFKSLSAEQSPDESFARSSYIVNIFDFRLPSNFYTSTFANHADIPVSAKLSLYFSKSIPTTSISQDPDSGKPIDVLRIREGDRCPACENGQLKVRKAIELGHTFHLGTRYSEPLNAKVSSPAAEGSADSQAAQISSASRMQSLQMGCHGIGITRIIGAFAGALADKEGLNWPRVMAPFEVVVIPGKESETAATDAYDVLAAPGNNSDSPAPMDVVIDDRGKSFAWKLKDANLIGIPVLVILGKSWKERGKCEVQCRRLQIKTEVALDNLHTFVRSLLSQL